MTYEFHFLGEVLAKLKAVKHSEIKQIGVASGVPESTVRKLYYGEVVNPRVQTVQALHDYFSRESSDQSSNNTAKFRSEKKKTKSLTNESLPHESNSTSASKGLPGSIDRKADVKSDRE